MRDPSFGGNLRIVGLILGLVLLAQALLFGVDRVELPSPTVQETERGGTSLTYLEETLVPVQEGRYESFPGHDDWEKAIDGERRALLHFRRSEDERQAALSLRRIGSLYQQRGEPHLALEHYQRALRLFREAVDHSGEASALIDIGDVYLRLGESFRGLKAFQTSREMAIRIEDRREEARALQGLGHTYVLLGELERAHNYYLDALKVSHQDPAVEASLLTDLADLALLRGEQDYVPPKLLRALQVWRRLGDLRGEARTLLVLGNACAAKGDRAKALRAYDRVLALSSGDPWLEAQALHGMAIQSSLGGDTERALALFEKALHRQRSFGDLSAESATLLAMAHLERRLGRLDSALERTEAAIQKIESLRDGALGPELRSAFLASKQADYEFQIDLLMEMQSRYPDQGYDAQALEVSERARARSLLDLLAEAHIDIRQGVDPSLLLRERRLASRLGTIEQRPEGEDERELRNLRTQLDVTRARIRASSPGYAQLAKPRPLTVREIQRSVLDSRTLLLEYALGEERSFLWAVGQDSLTSFVLPARREIETEARRFHELLSRRNRLASNAAADSAQRLSEMILGPVRAQLGGRRLAIVADGALQYVPFAALRVPGLSDEPLIVRHELVMLPSASVVAVQRKNARPVPSKTLAVLADPVFSTDDPRLSRNLVPSDPGPTSFAARRVENHRLARLLYTRKEAEAILSLVPPGQSLAMTGFAANRELALSPELSQFRYVHFATHGLIDSHNLELSGLALSTVDARGRPREGFLSLQDIYDMPLEADLVVLGACETALGREVRGEGLVGLTRGFLSAGAKQVLAGLWDAHDAATAELMKRFYRAMLVEGLPPSSALREAQRSMWKEPEWRMPYYWAGFVLQGEWQ